MSRANHTSFASQFASLLPDLDKVEERSDEFWEILEVNATRVSNDARSTEYVERILSPLGIGGLQAACSWIGLDPQQSKANLKSTVAEQLSLGLDSAGQKTLVMINEFLYRRRSDSVETISRLLLPEVHFSLVHSSELDAKSKRLCYTLLIYNQNPHQLRLLMVYEKAERAGHTRYVLIPKAEVAGQSLDEETAELALQRIREGTDLEELEIGKVNDILEVFESKHGQHQSQCFELFKDGTAGVTLLFVLRHLRESHIREVEGIIFADEAELIVLRLYNNIRRIEEHSTSKVGVQIANELASQLLETSNIEYIRDEQLTTRDNLVAFIGVLSRSGDEHLRLQELYLSSAPIQESPKLILRCDKTRDLSLPIDFLGRQGINLLNDLDSIRNINIAYVVGTRRGETALVFKVFCRRAGASEFFLPYSAANVSTQVRSSFEQYVREEYNVKVIPGTG